MNTPADRWAFAGFVLACCLFWVVVIVGLTW